MKGVQLFNTVQLMTCGRGAKVSCGPPSSKRGVCVVDRGFVSIERYRYCRRSENANTVGVVCIKWSDFDLGEKQA